MLLFHNKKKQVKQLPESTYIPDVANLLTTTIAELEEVERQVDSLNQEQRLIYDRVMAALASEESNKCFFLDGPGGSGKTYLLNTIMQALRVRNVVAQSFATTGIASLLVNGGRTAHSGYKLPIPALDNSASDMDLGSPEAQLMRRASLHIIDEIPMLVKHLLRCIDLLLRKLKRVDKTFGGIVMIGSGDFRQTAPVVLYGTREKIIMASIKSSPLWSRFEHFTLATNMRAHADPEFAQWILRIGNGTTPTLPTGQVEIPADMIVDNVIEAIYGSDINLLGIEQLAERVVLASTNAKMLEMNSVIIEQLHGEARTYLSADSVISDEQQDLERYSTEFINQQTPSGMPPHELTLKVGTIIMLVRNIQQQRGLCNGTRLRLRSMHDYFLCAEVITGSCIGDVIFIPRMHLKPSESLLPFVLLRIQFPVIPAFAMTISKSQGQTFEHVGIYLEKPVFTHGLLYTAVSRGRKKNNVKFHIVDSEQQGLFDDGKYYTPNIVYQELLI